MLRIALPAALFLAGVVSANPLPSNPASMRPSDFTLAPLYTPPAPPASSFSDKLDNTLSHIIRDSYLVVLQDHLEPHQIERHHAHVHSLHLADARLAELKASASNAAAVVKAEFEGLVHKFHIGNKGSKRNNKAARKMLKGYSGHFSENTLDAIRSLPEVKYVERDSLVWASEVEKGAPWGLARISHRAPLSFGTFNKYEYDGNGGEGVDAYVIDTGINIAHVELEGRARWGKTIPKDADEDSNGHGSHVAGTIASAKYGVAKRANLVAVKVLGAGGSGTMSDVVAGVAWAADSAYAAAAAAAKERNPKHKGSVANMSLGGGKSQALDDAVDAAVEDGLHFAVAAGNDNKDACAYSPAASRNAITVGASTIADERAYFSNHGKCVDIFGPGLNIASIWNTGNRSINTISGTSMASPHVAGLAAYFLSLYPSSFVLSEEELGYTSTSSEPSTFFQHAAQFVFGQAQQWTKQRFAPIPPTHKPLTPKALKNAMVKLGTKGILTDLPELTPNILMFNNFTSPARIVEILQAEAELESN